ncbi:uncharacterized protein LOC126810383 [Patella vulgata]|uniref:uncharacterized protein LOC126810383 n=1 Tax=Patella vulgata TaxID=6465 RepID=UPI0024A8634E|nr:uncharacterized protein LOC126810383 [Patella vulgata]
MELFRRFTEIGIPVLLSAGIVGNILILLALLATKLKRVSFSQYLIAISISDLAYLLSTAIIWISDHWYDIFNITGICQLTTYTWFLANFLSTWFLVFAHIERCLINFASGRRKLWCSLFRTKCIIIVVAIFSMVANLYILWTHMVIKNRCRPMPESVIHLRNLRKVDVVFTVLIPMAMIISMDICLMLAMTSRFRRRYGNDLHKGPITASQNGRLRNLNDLPNFVEGRVRTTATCVTSGLLYLTFSIPSLIIRMKLTFTDGTRRSLSDLDVMLSPIFHEIVKINFVYKFFLYILVLRGFQRAVLNLFRSNCCRKRQRTTDPSIVAL